MKKLLLSLALLVLAALPANATTCSAANGTCFWIGGTGTLDLATDSAHWASTTGGTTCSCEPSATAELTFDGSSGGGTVTVNANIIQAAILSTNFTGTLDWSANNNNVTLTATATFASCFTDAGTGGTHTINMGSGAWVCSSPTSGSTSANFTNTNLTLNADTSTITFKSTNTTNTNTPTTFALGGKTFATVTFSTPTTGQILAVSGANTFGTLNCSGGFAYVGLPAATTQTVSTTLNLTGSSGTECIFASNTTGSTATISAPASTASGSWVAFHDVTFSTSAPTFSNCTNLGHNSFNGGSCTAPSGGGSSGGGFLIGG